MASILQLLDEAWFGRPTALPLEAEPSEEAQAPQLQRESTGSLSDGANNEQAEGKAEQRRREPRRPPPASQQVALGPARGLQNGRLPQLDDEEDGVLGTWAGRQRIFSEHLRETQQDNRRQQQRQRDASPSPQPEPTAAASQRRDPEHALPRDETPPVIAPAPLPGERRHGGGGGGGEESLDREIHDAWRWRFTRKWQAEQMKQFEPPPAAGASGGLPGEEDEEEWVAALRMLDKVEGGLNMQIGRTLSLHNSGGLGDSGSMELSHTLMSPGLSQLLLDGSVKESPLRDAASDATSQIVSMARKAQHLRLQQQEIERQVNQRWEAASGGGPWVAQHLPAVQIDSWSSFAFVLVRLGEQRSGRQKLLVRGRNGATEQQAYATTEQEAARAAIANRLPGPRVELVAGGRMEWVAPGQGQERRTLVVRVTRLLAAAAKDSRLHSTAAASGVVAELTRASFPSGNFDIVAAEAPGGSKPGGSRP